MPLGLSGSGLITGFDPTASGFGKVLQVVRATDTTNRTTTSTSLVDASISVIITPKYTTSKILLIYTSYFAPSNNDYCEFQISDSSNNGIQGAERSVYGATPASGPQALGAAVLFGWANPASLSAQTYKIRFKSASGGTATIINSQQTGQLFAIEVAA